MKRKIFVGLFVIMLLASLISCASFIKNSYVTLNESRDLYYTAMGVAADFQTKGVIDQVKRDEINKVAKIYKEAHNTAVDALAVYKKTSLVTDKEKFSVALSVVFTKWGQVAALINAIKAGTIQSTITK